MRLEKSEERLSDTPSTIYDTTPLKEPPHSPASRLRRSRYPPDEPLIRAMRSAYAEPLSTFSACWRCYASAIADFGARGGADGDA